MNGSFQIATSSVVTRTLRPSLPSPPQIRPIEYLDHVLRALRGMLTPPLLSVHVTVAPDADAQTRQNERAAFAPVQLSLDMDIAEIAVLTRVTLSLGPLTPDRDLLVARNTEINRAAKSLLDRLLALRSALEFLARSWDSPAENETGLEPAVWSSDFYCEARDGEPPATFLTPPTADSTLKLVGRIGAIGAMSGTSFLELDTSDGVWRIPLGPRNICGLLALLHAKQPLTMMVRPARGIIFWADSADSPPATASPSPEERERWLHQRWSGALERLAR